MVAASSLVLIWLAVLLMIRISSNHSSLQTCYMYSCYITLRVIKSSHKQSEGTQADHVTGKVVGKWIWASSCNMQVTMCPKACLFHLIL